MNKNGKSNIDIVRDYLDGVRPFIQVGYTGKKYTKRNIGDKWTDAKGIEWEQKESGPVRVNRVGDIIRKTIGIDKCKSCNAEIRWGTKTDQLLHRKTGLCTNCLIDYETKLRILGIYNEYETLKLVSNEIGYLKDMAEKIKDTIEFFSKDSGDITAICNSEGFVERWKNTNQQEIVDNAKRDLELINKRVKSLDKIRKECKKTFIAGAKKYKMEIYV